MFPLEIFLAPVVAIAGFLGILVPFKFYRKFDSVGNQFGLWPQNVGRFPINSDLFYAKLIRSAVYMGMTCLPHLKKWYPRLYDIISIRYSNLDRILGVVTVFWVVITVLVGLSYQLLNLLGYTDIMIL